MSLVDKEYMNGTVIDMVLLNMNIFCRLMTIEYGSKLKIDRVGMIIRFIKGKINQIMIQIYKKIENKYYSKIDDDIGVLLRPFIAKCCNVTWGVLHYDLNIYPLNYTADNQGVRYDDKIHDRRGGSTGDKIQYYIFPAIMNDKVYESKVWVICDE